MSGGSVDVAVAENIAPVGRQSRGSSSGVNAKQRALGVDDVRDSDLGASR